MLIQYDKRGQANPRLVGNYKTDNGFLNQQVRGDDNRMSAACNSSNLLVIARRVKKIRATSKRLVINLAYFGYLYTLEKILFTINYNKHENSKH